MILSTHDVGELAAAAVDRVVILSEGEVVVDGGTREVMSHSMVFSSQINRCCVTNATDGGRRDGGPVHRLTRWLDSLILLAASLGGLAAFLYPFFTLAVTQSASGYGSHSAEAPLLTIGLVTLCLGAVLATLGGGGMNAKMVAVLGVLVAANAVLRAVPGPAGFAAVFMLPVLCGYLYGATFGFLLGSLSLLVSALIGAGVGPWLPYQMLAVGWVGLTSAGLWPALRVLRLERHPRREVAILGAWGLLWGFSFWRADERLVLALRVPAGPSRSLLAAGHGPGPDVAPLCRLLRRHFVLVGSGARCRERAAHLGFWRTHPAAAAPAFSSVFHFSVGPAATYDLSLPRPLPPNERVAAASRGGGRPTYPRRGITGAERAGVCPLQGRCRGERRAGPAVSPRAARPTLPLPPRPKAARPYPPHP